MLRLCLIRHPPLNARHRSQTGPAAVKTSVSEWVSGWVLGPPATLSEAYSLHDTEIGLDIQTAIVRLRLTIGLRESENNSVKFGLL